MCPRRAQAKKRPISIWVGWGMSETCPYSPGVGETRLHDTKRPMVIAGCKPTPYTLIAPDIILEGISVITNRILLEGVWVLG